MDPFQKTESYRFEQRTVKQFGDPVSYSQPMAFSYSPSPMNSFEPIGMSRPQSATNHFHEAKFTYPPQPASHFEQATLNRSPHSANHFEPSTMSRLQQPMNHYDVSTSNRNLNRSPQPPSQFEPLIRVQTPSYESATMSRLPPQQSEHYQQPSYESATMNRLPQQLEHYQQPSYESVTMSRLPQKSDYQQPILVNHSRARVSSTATPTSTTNTQGSAEYVRLQDELINARALYVDPKFPPNNSSLYTGGRAQGGRYAGSIVWKRPKDMVNNPKFMYQGASRHDLDQGYLGNCWYVAGVAVLATSHPGLMARVAPRDQGFEQERYTGMFRFNFWRYGKWEEVLVDDYLPTDGFRPIYCSNRERPDEFWSCLLEKAYAKLHGSYQALEGGNMQNSLVDMTGGISETIDLTKKDEVSPELYSLMVTSFNMRTLMGGAIFLPTHMRSSSEVRRSNGLYMGHAYSITGLKQIPTGRGTVNLIRLRNPWGRREWNGAWSDNSPEMRSLSRSLQDEMNFVNLEDGEFWISYDDFVFNVDQLQLCHLSPDAFIAELEDNDKKQQWNVTAFHDAWIRGVTAGGCGNPPYQALKWKNPQFYITLEQPDHVHGHGDDCTLIVSLMQNVKDDKPVAIGFDVFRLRDPSLRPLDGDRAPQSSLILTEMSGTFVYNREVAKRFELKCGTYAIMPSTFKPHEESEFLLRLVTETRADSGVLDENVTPTPQPPVTPSPKPVDVFEEMFHRHTGSDNKLNAHEMKEFLLDISTTELKEPLDFSLESCRSIVTLMDENKSGFLSIEETKRAWKEIKAYRTIFKHFDVDNSNKLVTYELGTLFSKLGKRLGFPISRAVLTAVVRRYGDRDNNISLTDFILLVCKMTSLYASFHQQQRKRQSPSGTAEFTMNEYLEITMAT